MTSLEERDYTYFTTVRGMCRSCRSIVPARIFFREGKVWQESLCPSCETKPVLIAGDKSWYLKNVLRAFNDHSPLPKSHPPRQGCPHDCGPCHWHASSCQLPVVSITNACNLDCPICFTYNRKDRRYFMSPKEITEIVDWIVDSSGPVDLINITGGEPTLHPRIIDILRSCQRPEIGRVTMNSNGLKLAEDIGLCESLAELGVYVVLSLNTFDEKISLRLHGRPVVEEKLKAIENLTRAGVKMTLLYVMVKGINEQATKDVLELMQSNDQILSLTVQTMTYTGQGGGIFLDRRHLPVDEASRIICQHSGGMINVSDFTPRPAAHPLCYSVCYLFKSGQEFLPFTRFVSSQTIETFLKDSYLIRPEGGEGFFRDVINQLYANGETVHLETFRSLVEQLFPPDGEPDIFRQQQLSESVVRTIYVHAHMDEDNFDCSRAMLCPDLVPAEPGRLIPACTYNLFYRRQDNRFYHPPEETIV